MQFVTEDIDSYVSRKRNNHVHGNHIEIQAISEIFNRPVEIYAYHTGKFDSKKKKSSTLTWQPLQNHIQFHSMIILPCRACKHIRIGANKRRCWAITFAVPTRIPLQCNFKSIQTDRWSRSWIVRLSNYRWIAKCETFTGCGTFKWRFGNRTDNVWG